MVENLEGDNGALMVENGDLKERVDNLMTELSIKEAKWCEMEEQYKITVNIYFALKTKYGYFGEWVKGKYL